MQHMTLMRDEIIIKTKPSKIFNWFSAIDENYNDWHPDHVQCKWVKGKSFDLGSILYVEEYLHGDLHKIKFETTEVIKNEIIKYKFKFPMSLICNYGVFRIQAHDKGSLLISELNFRFGWLIKRIMRKRYLAFYNHMKEESSNLKTILETEDDFMSTI